MRQNTIQYVCTLYWDFGEFCGVLVCIFIIFRNNCLSVILSSICWVIKKMTWISPNLLLCLLFQNDVKFECWFIKKIIWLFVLDSACTVYYFLLLTTINRIMRLLIDFETNDSFFITVFPHIVSALE